MTVAHDVLAVKRGHAERDNLVIGRRIALHDLVYEEVARGATPNTVSSSSATAVGSAVPQHSHALSCD